MNDLHCHSTFSDGTKTPQELIKIALEKGLKALSITDHDTIEVYKTFPQLAAQSGLNFISGIEFSSSHKELPIHILGYSFQLNHPAIDKLIHFHKKRRTGRNQEILLKLNKHGIPLSLEEIKEILPHMSHQIGRAHIAYSLYKKGLVNATQEAFKKWIGEGKPCYVESENPTIQQTIDALHQANGFAVVAHPHLIKRKNVIKAILNFGFDGIEANYALFHPQVNQRFIDMAKDRGLFITGGSDFHGEIRPHNPLGASTTSEEVFLMLQERFIS